MSGVFQYRITGRTPVNFGIIEHQIEDDQYQFTELLVIHERDLWFPAGIKESLGC